MHSGANATGLPSTAATAGTTCVAWASATGASAAGTTALILDGRRAGSVRSALGGEPGGTRVG